MKGQTQAVTAVLITTVVVGSVATAYVWGTPILEKRQNQANLAQVETNVFDLYDKVIEVSRSGSGTTERIELPSNDGSVQVQINEEQDYIDIITNANNPPYPLDTWSLIRGKSLQNLSFSTGQYAREGQDMPGVVAVKPAGGAGQSVVVYRIEFRNLYVDSSTGDRLKKIDLEAQGRSRAVEGATLLITNQGTELDAGKNQITLSSGRTIERTRTVVEIDIR